MLIKELQVISFVKDQRDGCNKPYGKSPHAIDIMLLYRCLTRNSQFHSDTKPGSSSFLTIVYPFRGNHPTRMGS